VDLVFAVPWQRRGEPIGARISSLARLLGTKLGCRVTPKVALSYEELIGAVRNRTADVAWLPPILRWVLEKSGDARVLLLHERGSKTIFHSVIACAKEAKFEALEGLAGARAAWVDPWSAAGYVMPRLVMYERGIDAKKALLEEKFCGSHDAAIRRVLGGHADIVATHANLDPDGHIQSTGWHRIEEARGALRLLASVGVIPTDVIAARRDLDDDLTERIARALIESIEDESTRAVVQDALEIESFRAPEPSGDFGESLARAKSAGLFPHL